MVKQQTEYQAVVDSPVGHLGIRMQGELLAGIDFLSARTKLHAAHGPSCAAVVRELQCYFRDPAWKFGVPLLIHGTPFRMKVWRHLRTLASGEVASYGDIAATLASSARAVGGACRANAIPIIIPCHRVVAHSGIGGFSGATSGPSMRIKRWLLEHEGAQIPARPAGP